MRTQEKLPFHWFCLQVLFATALSDVWKAEVTDKVKALVSSCVVMPCSFNYPGTPLPDSRISGIWHKKDKKENIYHEDQTEVADSFKDRTELLGRLGEKNCTLEIDRVRDHDNGPFCFRAEIPELSKYSFVEACVTIPMMLEPEKPTLEQLKHLEVGTHATFKCSIKHTCPSHPPTITWSHLNSEATWNNRDLLHGNWEVESLLTFIPNEEHDFTDITCNVTFHGGIRSSASITLHVKRKANILHIIIPIVAVAGTAILFGGVCFFMTKKYKQQIQELQSRNENRSYLRSKPDIHMHPKQNNCASTVSGSAGFSTSISISIKSEHKPYSTSKNTCSEEYDEDDHTNLADLKVYRNI